MTSLYASGRFLRATAVWMNRRATIVAPGVSFTVGGTAERSSAGLFRSGVAVEWPVFEQ